MCPAYFQNGKGKKMCMGEGEEDRERGREGWRGKEE